MAMLPGTPPIFSSPPVNPFVHPPSPFFQMLSQLGFYFLDGRCDFGFAGVPSRTCDLPLITEDQSYGVFGSIVKPCILLPAPQSPPPTADAYSTSAVISWNPHPDCISFHLYLVNGIQETPLNNGQGLLLAVPTITAVDVLSLSLILFCPAHFISLS